MELTEDYINEISPDTPSTKNANKLLSKTQWLVKKSNRAIWSEIYGSGKKPYLAQIDSQNIAFKCTCPSRKFPCKHGLALGLYVANNDLQKIVMDDEPLWVKEWIDKRKSKAITKTNKTPVKEKSPEVTQKQNNKKWSNAVLDVAIVELWLLDVVKIGISDFPSKHDEYWEKLKKRMVDIKLTGFNSFFNLLQTLDYGKDWEQKVLAILAEMHLLVQSIKHHEIFDDMFKTELGFLLGWSVSKQELLKNTETEVVDDKWIVVKVSLSENSGLTVRKVYLYGTATNHWAYILEFAHGNSYFTDLYVESVILQAKLLFYNGVLKTRAYLKVKGADEGFDKNLLKPFKNLDEAHENYKDVKMLFSWVSEYPQFVALCNVVEKDSRFYLVDEEDGLLPLLEFSMEKYFELISQTRGYFFDAFYLQTKEGVELLGFYQDEKVVSL